MTNPSVNDDTLLRAALDAAVPLWIATLRDQSLDELIAEGPDLAQIIAEKGDRILYKSKKPGETASAFNALARGIAILSFMPGGVTIFSQHWEHTHPDSARQE